MQNVNKLQRDEETLKNFEKKNIKGNICRLEDNRTVLFDS
jgi:hypothetical protein